MRLPIPGAFDGRIREDLLVESAPANLEFMSRRTMSPLGNFSIAVSKSAARVVVALLASFRDLFASSEVQQTDERQLHDSDLSGEMNYRTGRLDSGTDPYGWYDRD